MHTMQPALVARFDEAQAMTATGGPVAGPAMIRVATYNIRKCVGLDWRRDPERTMRVIGEIKPDIIALQEADRRLGARAATLDAAELLRHTSLHLADFGDPGPQSGWHGNAILVRAGIEVQRTRPVDLPSFEKRGALIVDVLLDGLPLRIAGVHLGLRRSDRRRQIAALMDYLKDGDDVRPTMILGDMNEWSRASAVLALLDAAFAAAPPLASFHTARPIAALDRIFLGPGLSLHSVTVHRSKAALRASDHLPVWADIRVDPPGPGMPADRPAQEDGTWPTR